ncbi:MAG: hypothetical protein AAF843_10435 [Bacteroidota bacterium]
MTKRIACIALLLNLLIDYSYAQKIDKEQLYTTWCLDKYSDAEEYYQPPKKEIGDYIMLNKDMTYKARSEGDVGTGTWMFNTNGNYIELKDEEKEAEKLYVYFLSEQSLVVVYDVDEYRVWEVHYVSCK